MALFTGVSGKVVVGSSTVANVTSFSITVEARELEAGAMGQTPAGWSQYITGLRSWSGRIEASWDLTDTAGQKALFDALTGLTPVTLYLYIDTTRYFTGQAYITSSETTVPYDGIDTITFDVRGTGALTLNV